MVAAAVVEEGKGKVEVKVQVTRGRLGCRSRR